MKKKILITGAAGFIGFHLLKEISKNNNFEITIIDNFSRGKKDIEFNDLLKKKRNIKVKKIDLTKSFKINKNYTHIFHLAAIVGVQNVKKNPIKTFDTNLISTLNILKAFETKKKKPLIIFFLRVRFISLY